ncbi:MAG: glycine cleavage system aminomethyltransferase GcvT [Bacteroidales bacterium]|jgi:aminomethyltransferase|nr:glycine cleavage system aminomethyltransferase GcvT [Bacteroidales bacterium]
MKSTIFETAHRKLGAKMALFAGFHMPIEYSGVNHEHMTVRNGVGVFDVSHMGEIWVKGAKALEFIQCITSNDASVLHVGNAQYSCMPNGKGGIVDDILVYRCGKREYLLVVNAANVDKDWTWIQANNRFGDNVELENVSDRMSQLAVQGPKAIEIMQKLTPVNLKNIPYYSFVTDVFADVKEVIISATGYTGSGGFELYFHNNDGMKIWDALFEAGKTENILPVGLAARDTLRLEKGFCLYGNDIDDTTSPIEAGLGRITKFVPGKNFIDKERLLQQKMEGVTRRLVGLEMVDRGIPRHGYGLFDSAGNHIGQVTSGTMSPCLKIGIGMGYVATQHAATGSEIYVSIRDKHLKAKTVKFPFV